MSAIIKSHAYGPSGSRRRLDSDIATSSTSLNWKFEGHEDIVAIHSLRNYSKIRNNTEKVTEGLFTFLSNQSSLSAHHTALLREIPGERPGRSLCCHLQRYLESKAKHASERVIEMKSTLTENNVHVGRLSKASLDEDNL